jgi:hypothetical protein
MRPEPPVANLRQENVAYLRNWAAATDREVQSMLAVLTPLQQRLEKARERLDLITRLADLVETETREEPTRVDVTDQALAGKSIDEVPSPSDPAGSGAVFGGPVKEIPD